MGTNYSFKNDYSEGAHPKILEALTKYNEGQEEGYGNDQYSQKAAELIKARCNDSSSIHFVSGGTQANIIVLSSLLRPYESVVSASSGHINVHEAGAIEATGHKVNIIQTDNGKITPEQVDIVVTAHPDEHMVKPRVVFISQSTEVGTIYSKEEIQTLRQYCNDNRLYLYVDGARLGSGLTAEGADVTLKDLGELCDVFYVGGTKNGALCGEAIVINNIDLQKNFRYFIKQRGGLIAKGKLIGLQFLALFEDNLYFDLAKHANSMAKRLTAAIKNKGFSFLTDSVTNQIFPIFQNELINKLQQKFDFYVWEKVDAENSAIRLVTSWATREEAVEAFISEL